MLENQLSRYGAISRIVPDLAPGAKVFLVCDSDDTTVGPFNLGAEYPVDKDGVVRVYTTVQAAINAGSADRGDIALVLPGYDHTLGRTDCWNTAGMTVLGLGSGNGRPIVRYETATDLVCVPANNVTIKNMCFLADADSVTLGVNLDSGYSGAVIQNCVFDFDSNAQNFKQMLKVAQSRCLIEENEFLAEDTTGAGAAISFRGGLGDYTRVIDNFFAGTYDTDGDTTNGSACISIDVTHDSGDTILTGIEISRNTIVSTDTATAVILNFGGGATTVRGVVSQNIIASYDTAATDTDVIVCGNAIFIDNWLKTADSDRSEVMISQQAKFPGVQDS